jgi:hypothetical protein
MSKFRAKLALFLTLCIFLCSVNSMKVEATEIVAAGGITAASLFQICLFIGGVALTCYAAGEIIENKDEIAAFGKNFLDSVTDIPEGWIMSMTDISGQDYVFGSEALELVQDTEWEVIQGGAPNGDDDNNNDDDNDNKDKINLPKSPDQLTGSFYALGATWLADSISKLYQKWVNGDELTEAEQAVLKPLMEAGVDQNDIAKQWSGEPFLYTSECHEGYVAFNKQYYTVDHAYSGALSVPICARYFVDEGTHTNSDHQLVTIPWHHLNFYFLNKEGQVTGVVLPGIRKIYLNGLLQSSVSNEVGGFSVTGSYDYPERNVFSYSLNFPVFSSMIDVEAYLKGTGAVTDALNYAHTYENADWLSDDWKGLLIDPLTNIGLTLSQLTDLAKALGIHAVGNNLSAQELADLLKQSLPVVNPELMPDAVPVTPVVPDPDLKPIYYPSPTAHPLPGTNPGTNPGDNPDVTPDTDPKAEELPADDLVPTMNDSLGDIAGNLRYKFPFSIPWDIRHVFQVLADTPKAPRFELPLVIKRFDIDERIIVDMAMFQVLSNLSRSLFSMLFGMYLMNLTFKVVSMRKEE